MIRHQGCNKAPARLLRNTVVSSRIDPSAKDDWIELGTDRLEKVAIGDTARVIRDR